MTNCVLRAIRRPLLRPRDQRRGRMVAFRGKAVILTTGGAGRMFPFTTNGAIKTGDGMWMAYKVGVHYDYSDKWDFRAGYNYGKSPIPDDQVLFNFLAPATVEHHMTFGASYRQSKNIEWSFNFMHAFENTIKGPTAFGPTGAPVLKGENGSIKMKQTAVGVSFGFEM